MEPWLRMTLAILLAIGVGAGWTVWYGNDRWDRATAARLDDMDSNGVQSGAISPTALEDLPDPVARYFQWALADGLVPVRSATIRHEGEFLLDNGSSTSFCSTEVFRVAPPGFIWDARMAMAPLLTVRVRDTYVNGEGGLIARLLGWITVAETPSDEALDVGALMRYLAEAVWFPTALLPDAGVSWFPIDDERALATLSDGNHAVELEFRFAESGEVVSVYCPGRPRLVDGLYEDTPWFGEFSDYEHRDGMMIPIEGQVSWLLPEGPLTYWRGRIVDVEYETSDLEDRAGAGL